MTVSGTNFGNAATEYRSFRAGFPDSIFDRLATFGVGLSGQVVVDLGTGTGTLARGFARRGCHAFGVDVDFRMVVQARELDRREGVGVTYVVAKAESTGLDRDMADVVVAGQCWHWFDRAKAANEVVRLLKPGGRLVIAHFDWLPLAGNVVEATEKLIMEHNPKWRMNGGAGVHPQWFPGLSEAGFRAIESFSYDVDVPYTPEAWRGRIRASAGITAFDRSAVEDFDNDLATLLAKRFPASTLAVEHRVFAIVAQGPGG